MEIEIIEIKDHSRSDLLTQFKYKINLNTLFYKTTLKDAFAIY